MASAPRPAAPAARCGCSPTSHDTGAFNDGEVLVTHMTTPDWVPLMRKAAAIVTDSGGMTCHAAIVSRELGIPCVVGTGDATQKLRNGELVTVDATQGTVLEGAGDGWHRPLRRARRSLALLGARSPGRNCSSTCPSPRRWRRQRRSRSTAWACCEPS